MNSEYQNDLINIQILDRSYKIKCTPQEARELQESAQYVDQRMRRIPQTSSTNMDRVAVVTALNITHELLSLKQEQTQKLQQLNQRIQNLRDRVKNSLAISEEIAV